MTETKSVFLEFVTGKVNELLQSTGETPGRDDIARLLIENLLEILTLRRDLRDELQSEVVDRAAERHAAANAAAIGDTATNHALQLFDDLLAAGEGANQRLINAVCSRAQFWDFEEASEGDRIFLPSHIIHALLLFSFQARALMVAKEVAALSKLALYDGAEARIRTLYEIGIISRAIASDADYSLSERYHASGVYERLRDIRAYNETCAEMGFPPPGLDERADCESLVVQIEKKFGREIREPYGWALPIFGAGRRRVTFADLDHRFGGDELRSVYRLLNHSIHAGASVAALGVDFGSKGLTPARPIFHHGKSIRLLRVSSILLEALNYAVFESLLRPEEWDNFSSVALMREFRYKIEEI
ncbi:DUF5677 domain-containing protein [Actinoplanes sp. DH11]|uniref:DUF5677 domain-containing protein n=1 Tax=Actinoplanes sp. DH11 TaxID=2857011 RepID=UPI001E523C39|nr:DUF5677 domain-containing protein [Actinoplanes sp. DH11]